jgi:hypothetical protein
MKKSSFVGHVCCSYYHLSPLVFHSCLAVWGVVPRFLMDLFSRSSLSAFILKLGFSCSRSSSLPCAPAGPESFSSILSSHIRRDSNFVFLFDFVALSLLCQSSDAALSFLSRSSSPTCSVPLRARAARS